MTAHQVLPSLGSSRKEHWSGLPFPSPMHESEKWKWSSLDMLIILKATHTYTRTYTHKHIYTHKAVDMLGYFFKFKFIYFNWRLITLQYCIGFAIHQHESAMGVHVFPILNPPSHLPPHTIPLGHPSAPAPSFLYPATNLDWRLVSKDTHTHTHTHTQIHTYTGSWLKD